MNENIQKLIDLGPVTVITIIILIITLIPLIVNSWKELLNALGLISKQSVEENQKDQYLQELRNKVDDYQKEIEDKQEIYHEQSISIRAGLLESQERLDANQKNLKDDIKELRTMFVDKEINDLRWEILSFSYGVTSGRKYNQESYNHILEMYDIYEAILEREGKSNGRVDSSIAFIKDKYAELMTNSFEQ